MAGQAARQSPVDHFNLDHILDRNRDEWDILGDLMWDMDHVSDVVLGKVAVSDILQANVGAVWESMCAIREADK